MADEAPSDLARVRTVLMRELETINTYEEMARTAQNDTVRNFFLHLAKEEKEHVAEATLVLRSLDADQEAFFKNEIAAEHFGGTAPMPSAAQAQTTHLLELERLPVDAERVLRALPAPPGGGAFTVGSLKRLR